MSLSRVRLAALDEHLRVNYIENQRYPGVLTGIYRHGELVHASPLGFRDIDNRRPVERDTIFRIYSMTKPITSIALMTLYEKGLFQLDDPVSRYLPQFSDLMVFSSGSLGDFQTTRPDREMTVRDLLSHQSGLTYGFMNRTNVDRAYADAGIGGIKTGGTLETMVNSLGQIPLEFSPGTRWNYSVSTDVCGYLIEVLSGKSLDIFLEEVIFQPLGMNDTAFSVEESKKSRLASLYGFEEIGPPRLISDSEAGSFIKKPTFLSGGGGLTSTLDDYMAFCKMILGNGTHDGELIVSRKTIELMSSNHLPNGVDLQQVALGRWSETQYQGVGFGLGFSVLLSPSASQVSGSKGELAWGGAASTAFWIDKSEDLAVIFLTQLLPSSAYNVRRELRTLVYSAIDD
tara:strand:- start:648 stop:1847 length:1200 start_codon:yes stop_codon:yes gene_type:complete